MSPAVRHREIGRQRALTGEERVTPIELFFDLVFVFAITQVTSMLAADLTWGGLVRGLLVLAAIWWAWTGYAWVTNLVDPDEGGVRLAFFAAMAAMLIVALAVPGAFEDDALVFGIAYMAVRALHIVLLDLGAGEDEGVRGATRANAPFWLVGPALILLASAFDGAAQVGLWALALAIDYSGPLLFGVEGWRVSPAHFAERHGLIIIIALGESIVALGIGASGLELGPAVIAAAILGIVVAAALWWTYFDVVALVAQQMLTEAEGRARNALARDSYSYLHLPMVAGIVLFALGAKSTLAHVHEPLETIPAVGLCGGVALYLLAHVAFRLRNRRTLARRRLVVAALCLALIPAVRELEALASLGLIALLTAGLIAYEAIRFREARTRLRLARYG